MELGKTKLPARVSQAIKLFERAVREEATAKITIGALGQQVELVNNHKLAEQQLRDAHKNLRVVLHQALGNKL